MRTIDVIQGKSNRNQSLRLLLMLVIIATFPFYCFAALFIGSAPIEVSATPLTQTATEVPSFTPLATEGPPSATPVTVPGQIATYTPLAFLPPTPVQFVPPTPIPAQTIVAQTIVSPSPTTAAATATLAGASTAAIADFDFDTIADDIDNCPDEFGYADNAGCPYPDDPDRDGLRGDTDRCPNEFAPESPRGCQDKDDDGLDSSQDDCPAQAGPTSNRGCPTDDATSGG